MESRSTIRQANFPISYNACLLADFAGQAVLRGKRDMEIDFDGNPDLDLDLDLDDFHSIMAVGIRVIGIEIAIEIGIERVNGSCVASR